MSHSFPCAEHLRTRLESIASQAHLGGWAVSIYDAARGASFPVNESEVFHAASTFKVAILLAFADAFGSGELYLEDHLQVRNRFIGIVDGKPFRISKERDGDSSVHAQIGRSLPLRQLARVMVTRSSNLATNLLLDYLGLGRVQRCLQKYQVEGLIIHRGVEDMVAHDQGIDNQATGAGLCSLFQAFLPEGGLPEEARNMAIEILLSQEFNRMLPADLPKGCKVAHKTGEISTHCHDAGLIFPPGLPPYAVAILTAPSDRTEKRQSVVAEMSRAIYDQITARGNQ